MKDRAFFNPNEIQAMKKPRAETIDNRQEYKRRMQIWTRVYGISHRALERRYFGFATLAKEPIGTFKPLNFTEIDL